jgi:hypothetical protein
VCGRVQSAGQFSNSRGTTITLINTNTTATLDPYGATEGTREKPLAANKKFRATITTGAKDDAGNPLAKSFMWTFTTGSS